MRVGKSVQLQQQFIPQKFGGEQISSCLRDALRQYFPQQNAQGKTYSPIDDARFKSGIPGLIKLAADPGAVTLGLYDIHYDPSSVSLNGGSFESLKTIVEEVAHTVPTNVESAASRNIYRGRPGWLRRC